MSARIAFTASVHAPLLSVTCLADNDSGEAHRNPEGTFTHAVAFPWSPRELEGGVRDVGVQAQALAQALHEEGVPACKRGHRQNAYSQRAVIAPAHKCARVSVWSALLLGVCQVVQV